MEKFALLNLLKALETLSPQKPAENESRQNAAQETVQPASSPEPEKINVMANVLTRHEQISNRLKNNRP